VALTRAILAVPYVTPNSSLKPASSRCGHTARLLRIDRLAIAAWLVAAPLGCSGERSTNPEVRPAPTSAPAVDPKVVEPMAEFSRLVGGEWHVALTNGASAAHVWRWGPGRYSMRRLSFGPEAVDVPWGSEVLYWHPGVQEVRILSVHADIPGVGRGVGEGTIRFVGESAEGSIDLHQPRGLRKLGLRWTFEGPDNYHDILQEDSGAGFETLVEWDAVRRDRRPTTQPPSADPVPPALPGHLSALEPLLSSTWGSTWGGTSVLRDGPQIVDGRPVHATFQWSPSLEVVVARLIAPSANGETSLLLEAYVYRDVRSGAVRCLGLSNRGTVYEGDLTVLDGGALRLDLTSYDVGRTVPLIARLEFAQDGTLRQRVWSADVAEPALLLDLHLKRLESESDPSP
jgi:hypothetical protein